MSAVIAWLLNNPTVLAFGATIIGALGFGFQQRLAGAKAERNKQAAANVIAATQADEIDDAVAGRAPDDNRGRLGKWSPKQ